MADCHPPSTGTCNSQWCARIRTVGTSDFGYFAEV